MNRKKYKIIVKIGISGSTEIQVMLEKYCKDLHNRCKELNSKRYKCVRIIIIIKRVCIRAFQNGPALSLCADSEYPPFQYRKLNLTVNFLTSTLQFPKTYQYTTLSSTP